MLSSYSEYRYKLFYIRLTMTLIYKLIEIVIVLKMINIGKNF